MFDYMSRITNSYAMRWYILCYNTSTSNNYLIANSHSTHNYSIRSYKTSFPNIGIPMYPSSIIMAKNNCPRRYIRFASYMNPPGIRFIQLRSNRNASTFIYIHLIEFSINKMPKRYNDQSDNISKMYHLSACLNRNQ